MAIRVLEETGLLPHLNPGVMSWSEMSRLKPVAPSMGMMLETTSRRLFETKGLAHYGSPDKDPAVRLRTLTDAGRLSIPFTTGLLVGIGETLTERAETLHAIRKSHKEFGHVQEVIVQNFRAKEHTAMAAVPDAGIEDYLATVAVARLVLGPGMRIQAPPNLVSRDECLALIGAGVDDWGGVSPLTPDHVNPERPWPALGRTGRHHRRSRIRAGAAVDRAAQVRAGGRRVDRPAGARTRCGAGRSGDRAGSRRQPGGHALAGARRRGVRRAGSTSTRRSTPRAATPKPAATSTVPSVTGNRSARTCTSWPRAPPQRIDTDVLAALRSAERDPAGCTDDEYLALATADGPALEAVAALADSLRRDTVGDDVTFVVNRNINFTNVCYTGCRFCAFAQRKGDADAYSLSADEVADRAWEAHVEGATEVCMQGGIDPELPVTGYADLVRAVKARVPSMHVHAFSPMEIANGVTKSGLSIREWLISLREAGLDTIPGTAAEILDDEVRWVLTKGKLPTSMWIEIVTTAHEVGLRSSSTMMYGHVDSPRHWVGHLNVLRDIQDRTGGFTEFVPLPFVHQNSPLYLAGAARPGPSHRDNRAVHALARIMLHGRISHIQTSWVKLGVERTQVMLNGGANDLGGTLMEETISRMAGSEHGSAKTVAELVAIAEGIGRPGASAHHHLRAAGRLVGLACGGAGYPDAVSEISMTRAFPEWRPFLRRGAAAPPRRRYVVRSLDGPRHRGPSSRKRRGARPGVASASGRRARRAHAASRSVRARCAPSTTRTFGTRCTTGWPRSTTSRQRARPFPRIPMSPGPVAP